MGVLVFTGLTAYDTQNIKEQYATSFKIEFQARRLGRAVALPQLHRRLRILNLTASGKSDRPSETVAPEAILNPQERQVIDDLSDKLKKRSATVDSVSRWRRRTSTGRGPARNLPTTWRKLHHPVSGTYGEQVASAPSRAYIQPSRTQKIGEPE